MNKLFIDDSFPVLIQMVSSGEQKICKTPKDAPWGKAFKVIKFNVDIDAPLNYSEITKDIMNNF